LIPEIPHDLQAVVAWLKEAERGGRRPSLLVAAEGARPKAAPTSAEPQPISAMRKSLSPLADPSLGEGAKMIDRSGRLAESLALEIRMLISALGKYTPAALDPEDLWWPVSPGEQGGDARVAAPVTRPGNANITVR